MTPVQRKRIVVSQRNALMRHGYLENDFTIFICKS